MENEQKISCATLAETLGAYAERDCARFHMPGHKGRGMNGLSRDALARWDVTELSFSDNLHDPAGPIARAQAAMAEAYGAKASFFVVNGCTAAVQAMLLALDPGERLLLYRDCHKCAVGGAALAGLDAVFISPGCDAALDLLELPTPAALDAALSETGATAVLITSPNAYGLAADVAGLAETAHRRGALLLVDGAHGAHFPFSDALPAGLAGYADLWSHSQHKTLNAFTQAASLHLGPCRVRPDTVQRALSLLQTSSPSYLLMASLDWSRYTAARQDWAGHVARCARLRADIGRLPGLAAQWPRLPAGAAGFDPTRLAVDVTARGISGYEALCALEKQDIYSEMADARRLVLITSPEDDPAWYDRLLDALAGLPYGDAHIKPRLFSFQPPMRVLPLRAALLGRTALVPFAEAVEHALAETVGVYPPGIAAVLPGETLQKADYELLRAAEAAGATLFGVRGGLVAVSAP